MNRLEIRLLGSPTAVLDGVRLEIRRRKSLALLAYLAVTAREHTRIGLATLLYPDYPGDHAFANLRRTLYDLEQHIGPGFLAADRETIRLNLDEKISLDVSVFRACIASARDRTGQDALEPLARAVNLYPADFMDGFSLEDSAGFEDWQSSERAALRHEFASALERLSGLYAATARFPDALATARRLLDLDPLHEPAHRQLMRLYALSGDRSAAIRQFQECSRILVQELGVKPDAETESLLVRIKAGELSASPVAAPPPVATAQPPLRQLSPLPSVATPLVGRAAELEELLALLARPDCRLLTLTGAGGIGKTRLAIEVASRSASVFPDGIVYVSLAGLRSPESLIPAIAAAFGTPRRTDSGSEAQQLLSLLHGRRALIVLDNFEHIIAGAALFTTLLEATTITWLVTSRERLQLQSEFAYTLEGLSYPSGLTIPIADLENYPALVLFCQAANRADAAFRPTQSDLPALVSIARLVSGIPLALELAAAWIPVLSCSEIAAEIEKSVDFLAADSPDLPDRQRSIRAALDYSWNMLDEDGRMTFSSLSVFRGGFTRQAAVEILGVTARDLMALVKKSLIRRTTAGRFELHELLRQYAARRLAQNPAEEERIRDRHAAYYCAALKNWASDFKGANQRTALIEMTAEYGNWLLAWMNAVENCQVESIDRGIEGVGMYLITRGPANHGLIAFHKATLALQDCKHVDEISVRARCMVWEAMFTSYIRHWSETQSLAEHALTLSEYPGMDPATKMSVQAMAHYALGMVGQFIAEGEMARYHYDLSWELFHHLDERLWEAMSLDGLSSITMYLLNEPQNSVMYHMRSIEIKRSLDETLFLAGDMLEHGIINAYDFGDEQEALRLFRQAAEMLVGFEESGYYPMIIECRAQIASIHGDFDEARRLYTEQVALYQIDGGDISLAWSYIHLAGVSNSLGDFYSAVAHSRRSMELFASVGESEIQKAIIRWELANSLLANGELVEAHTLFLHGEQLHRDAVGKHSLGRELACLSRTEYAMGLDDVAWEHAREALYLLTAYRHHHWLCYALANFALQLASRGDVGQAVFIYALATRSNRLSHDLWFARLFGDPIAEFARQASIDVLSLQERAHTADFWRTAQDIAAFHTADLASLHR